MFERLQKIFGGTNKPKSVNALILIADDSEMDRRLVAKILVKNGYELLEATNGEEVVELAKKRQPQLIILDCDMPVLSGTEACKRLKNYLETKNIPVIFLTSDDTPKNIIDCFELDAENFLAKPINSRILLTQIRSVLSDASSA